ncbi:hypothetical protein [Rhodococcus koreensis]
MELMVRRFGFEMVFDYQEDSPDWGRTLMEGDEANLVRLAQYLGIAPKSADPDTEPAAEVVDAYTELVAAETALRDVIRLAVPNWQSQLESDDIRKLEAKRTEEDKKRDGITVSQDLLDYTEVYQLRTLIDKNWQAVKPVLDDKKRTDVYLDIVFDVRNTIGHSRPVVPSERLLLAGAAGQIRNQLARYRSSQDGSALHYSSIDSARDGSGQDAFGGISYPKSPNSPGILRVDVGDEITFEVAGTDPRGRELTWSMYVGNRLPGGYELTSEPRGSATGSRATIVWKVSREDVGENRYAAVVLRNTSDFQRHEYGYDAGCHFMYHVNPPLD